MYSELYQLSLNHSRFIPLSSGKTNLVLKRAPVGGNHIKVVIDKNGKLVRIIPCKQDRGNRELMLQACMDNKHIFPKVNFSKKYGKLNGVPTLDKGKTDFSGFVFDTDDKEIKKVAEYCKKTLVPAFSKSVDKNGKQTTLFGESVISFGAASLKDLFNDVFKELVKMSSVNDIAHTILENFVFLDEPKPGAKSVMMVCVEKNGKFSTDVDDYDAVASIVPSPKTVIRSDGKGGKVESYKNLPRYDFPVIGPLAIYARNENADSMSVYGRYGTAACVIPTERFNQVNAFLSEVFPADGDGTSYFGVPVSKIKNGGLLGVVYDEESGQKDLVDFLRDDPDAMKEVEFRKWQKDMVNAVKRMKETDDDYPVDFILISKIDKATSGMSLCLHRNKKDVLEKIRQWTELDMPRPSALITSLRCQFRFSGSKKIIPVDKAPIDKAPIFGYDQVLKFIFGDDKELNEKIIKTLYENIKAISLRTEHVTVSGSKGFYDPEMIITNSLKFMNYAIKKGNMMSNATLDKVSNLCKIANRLQIEYWKEHNIKGEFSRNIGGDSIALFQSYRLKDGYMSLLRGVQKYADWAESKSRRGKMDRSTFALVLLRKEMKDIDTEFIFNYRLKDLDVAQMIQTYITCDPFKRA